MHLERAGQTIDSDRLDLFARVIDNKLPPGAIASVEVAETAAPGEAAPADAEPSTPAATEGGGPPQPPESEAPASPGAEAEPAPAPSPSDNVTLTWTDVLEAVPIREEPPELADNHVLARFTATESGVVRFADAVAGDASGQAALLEYAMTTRDLVLGGPAQQNVSLKSADMGETRMSRIELSLATGEAYVPGPYTAIGADGISRADCGESARLRFKLVDGRITGELAEVELVGNARATDGESWIEANVLHAYFDDQTDGQSLLRRLQARDDVRLSDGRDADGACQVLDVAFHEDGSTPTSMEASASDGGYFRDDTARVDAQVMRAQFRRHESGSLEAQRVWAEGAVTFRRHADNIEITGERLFADADREYLEVEHQGDQARVARGATAIAGEVVRLQGVARTAEVTGRGSFEHRAGAGETASAIQASWSEGMAFDDLAGRLECLGDVAATHEPDPFTRDSIAAYALRVELDPASAAEQSAAPEIQADAPEQQAGDRRILSVYAAGEAFVGFGDALATIESARYGPASAEGAEPPLEQAFRLSGVEIFADNVAQTLDVPGRGRLFVADLRAAPEEEEDSDRGAALFDWRGSMHADRAAGTGEMLEGVQMTHTRLPDGTKTLLECARLRVAFAPGESEDTAFGGLRSAIADTNVYLRTDTRELTADLLQYDPDEGIARALASDNGRVNVLDRASGTPMSASAVVWDLNTDRVDIVDPGTITIPR